MKTYNAKTQIDFGMYKGQTIEEVYSIDPEFIVWCIRNLDYFYVEDLTQLDEAFHQDLNSENYQDLVYQTEMPNELVFRDVQTFMYNLHFSDGRFSLDNETIKLNNYKREISLILSKLTVNSKYSSELKYYAIGA